MFGLMSFQVELMAHPVERESVVSAILVLKINGNLTQMREGVEVKRFV